MSDALRLFFAARISVAAVEDLVHLVESMQPVARSAGAQVRWLAPESYHITLKYLGYARSEVEPALREAVDGIADTLVGGQISVHGVGAFPVDKKAKVLWAGLDDRSGCLKDLAQRLDTVCEGLGFPADKRPFVPHVTLARLTKAADVTSVLLPFSEDRFRKTRIDRLALMHSETRPSGAVYKARADWPLPVPK